jgi:hypothetical protein
MLTRTFPTLQAPNPTRTSIASRQAAGSLWSNQQSRSSAWLRLAAPAQIVRSARRASAATKKFGVNVNFALVSQQRR